MLIIPLLAPKQVTSVDVTTAFRIAGSVITSAGFNVIDAADIRSISYPDIICSGCKSVEKSLKPASRFHH